MSLKTEQDLFGDFEADGVVAVTPPGATRPVYLRYPSYDEWHSIAKAHFALEKEGKPADSGLIVRTVATCLADETGKPLAGDVQGVLMKSSPRRVMWLYRKCFATVMKSDDAVQEVEKN
jgi:hypothetical protein